MFNFLEWLCEAVTIGVLYVAVAKVSPVLFGLLLVAQLGSLYLSYKARKEMFQQMEQARQVLLALDNSEEPSTPREGNC